MKELSLNYQEMEWEEARSCPPGTLMKVLRRDEKGEPLTVLLKIGEGFEMEGHSHMGTEQHFVLEGEYESEGRVFGVESYRLIPMKAPQRTFQVGKRGCDLYYGRRNRLLVEVRRPVGEF